MTKVPKNVIMDGLFSFVVVVVFYANHCPTTTKYSNTKIKLNHSLFENTCRNQKQQQQIAP